jgi:cytoplasmic tRNA 2-thiolation protein 1
MKCQICNDKRALIKRSKTLVKVCKDCFYWAFEEEIHQTILDCKMFQKGQKVGIAASGGKDSTVLIHVISTLNDRYNYGIELFLVSIDEGIQGYRDDSLDTVKKNQEDYGIPLSVFSYKDLYGWSMDEIVKQVGLKNNCMLANSYSAPNLYLALIVASFLRS